MKVDENRIESFILNIQDSCINAKEDEVSKEKIVKVLVELLEISKSQSIPLEDVPRFLIEKIEEKQILVEDIQALREQRQTVDNEATRALQRKDQVLNL